MFSTINNNNSENPKRINEELKASKKTVLERLLELQEMRGKTPSEFLQYLQSFVTPKAKNPEEIIRKVWLSRLPNYVQTVLAPHTDLSLKKLAEIADSMVDLNFRRIFQHDVITRAETPEVQHEKFCEKFEEMRLHSTSNHSKLQQTRRTLRWWSKKSRSSTSDVERLISSSPNYSSRFNKGSKSGHSTSSLL